MSEQVVIDREAPLWAQRLQTDINALMAQLDRKVKTVNNTSTGAVSDLQTQIDDVVAAAASAASQAEVEAASDLTKFITPGRQKYHPGTAKAWAYVKVTAGVPAVTTSFNVTSVTDNGAGLMTITWDVDFSSADYAVLVTTQVGGTSHFSSIHTAPVAGSVALRATMYDASGFVDPASWHIVAFGDQ